MSHQVGDTSVCGNCPEQIELVAHRIHGDLYWRHTETRNDWCKATRATPKAADATSEAMQSDLLAHRLGLIHDVINSEDTREEAFDSIRGILLGQCDHLLRVASEPAPAPNPDDRCA